MKNALIATLLLASTAMADTTTERKSIFKLQNGSGHGTGFIVEGDLLLTAIHVADSWGDVGNLGKVRCELIHKQPMDANAKLGSALKDGVAVYRLTGGPYKSLRVALKPANLGTTCRLIGFPRNAFSVLEAKMEKGDDSHYNILDAEAVPGNSGGPCLSEEGHVVGLVTHSMPGKSLIVGTKILREAVRQAKLKRDKKKSPGLVIFSADFCGPCQQNRRTIGQLAKVSTETGHVYVGSYKGTKVTIVENVDGKWSDPGFVARYTTETKKSIDAYPTYWVPTSGKSRIGGLIGGVIGWAAETIKSIVGTLIGREYARIDTAPELDLEIPEPGPEGDYVTPAPPAEESVVDKLKKHAQDVAEEQLALLKDAMEEKLEAKLGEQKLALAKQAAAAAAEARENGESNRNILLAALASLVSAWAGKQTFVKRFAAGRIVKKIEELKRGAE